MEYLDASLYIVLVYVYPAIVALLSPLIGLRVGRELWAALVVTIIGVALTADVTGGGSSVSGVGLALAIGQAVCYAAFVIISAKLIRPQSDGLMTMGWSLIGSVLGMGALALVVGLRIPESGWVAVQLLAFAIVPTVVSGACFYQALRFLAPTAVSMIATLEPVLTVVWAVSLLGETLAAIQMLGAALVLAGVLWSQRSMA